MSLPEPSPAGMAPTDSGSTPHEALLELGPESREDQFMPASEPADGFEGVAVPGDGIAAASDEPAPTLDADKRIAFLERNIAAYEEEIKVLRERAHASHVQVSTMWELLRRMHDMVLVFDLQGLVAFVSPACATLLGFRPDELFDRPLSSILAPECHEDFEAHVQSTMSSQQVRSLATHELVTTHTFLRKDGSRIMLDGVGQAWQRGEIVEIVFVYRDRAFTHEAVSRSDASTGLGATSSMMPPAAAAVPWMQQRYAGSHLGAFAQSPSGAYLPPGLGASAGAFGGGAFPASYSQAMYGGGGAGFPVQGSSQHAQFLAHYGQALAASAGAGSGRPVSASTMPPSSAIYRQRQLAAAAQAASQAAAQQQRSAAQQMHAQAAQALVIQHRQLLLAQQAQSQQRQTQLAEAHTSAIRQQQQQQKQQLLLHQRQLQQQQQQQQQRLQHVVAAAAAASSAMVSPDGSEHIPSSLPPQ